jgi:predicted dehydrogenase
MRVAIVGLRGMGQSHARVAKACKVVSQVAGCDRSPEIAQQAAKTLEIPAFNDLGTLIREFKPDAVTVVTGPAQHAAVIRTCFEHKIPVLTEKPICSTFADSEFCVRWAQRDGIPFQCGFELRYCGFMRALKSVMEAGEIGNASSISLIQLSGPHTDMAMSKELTGGIFFEKLCHQVDLFRHLLGEPHKVMAIAAPNELEHYGVHDNVLSVFCFSDGLLGTIRFDTRRAAQVDGRTPQARIFDGPEAAHFYELIVTGNKGTAVFNAWTEHLDVLQFNHRSDRRTELIRSIPVRKDFGEPIYDLASQDGDFYEGVAAGRPLQFPASDALKTMYWVDRAEESLKNQGEWLQ